MKQVMITATTALAMMLVFISLTHATERFETQADSRAQRSIVDLREHATNDSSAPNDIRNGNGNDESSVGSLPGGGGALVNTALEAAEDAQRDADAAQQSANDANDAITRLKTREGDVTIRLTENINQITEEVTNITEEVTNITEEVTNITEAGGAGGGGDGGGGPGEVTKEEQTELVEFSREVEFVNRWEPGPVGFGGGISGCEVVTTVHRVTWSNEVTKEVTFLTTADGTRSEIGTDEISSECVSGTCTCSENEFDKYACANDRREGTEISDVFGGSGTINGGCPNDLFVENVNEV